MDCCELSWNSLRPNKKCDPYSWYFLGTLLAPSTEEKHQVGFQLQPNSRWMLHITLRFIFFHLLRIEIHEQQALRNLNEVAVTLVLQKML